MSAGSPSGSWDVAIVGGGPAGLATAIAARQRGLSIVVCDWREPPIDKACGEGLMPDAVERLNGWGVVVPPDERHPIAGIRYLDSGRVAAAPFSGGPGWGVRRPALHRALTARALEVGADLRWGVRITGLEPGGLRTDTGPLPAERVVGADGLHSRVRRWASLDRPARVPAERRRFGVRRHFEVSPWTDHVEVHWGDGAEAYVTPVSAGEVGVAILWSGRRAGFDELLQSFPELARRLAGRPASGRDLGAAALDQPTRGVVSGRVALVGDAAGYVDAITGEGLAAAFHQADALATALAAGRLELYAAAHRRLSRFPVALMRALLFVERRPRLRRRTVAALADDPDLFRRLLAVHTGHARPRQLAPGTILRLASALARA